MTHARTLALLTLLLPPVALAEESPVEVQVAALLAAGDRCPELDELALLETYYCTKALLACARDAAAPRARRLLAIRTLTLAGAFDDRVADALPELLADADAEVARAAEHALTPAATSDALERVLASPEASPSARRLALKELSFLDEVVSSSVTAMIAALDDPALEADALEVLLEWGVLQEDPAVWEVLEPALIELYPRLSVEQRAELISFSAGEHPGLWAVALRDPHPALRCEAVAWVAIAPRPLDPTVVGLLRAAIEDPDPSVREAAMFAVKDADLGSEELLRVLLEAARADAALPSTLESCTVGDTAAFAASTIVEQRVACGARPWSVLVSAYWNELMGWSLGVLAWVALVRAVAGRRRFVRRWPLLAVAVLVPVGATFAGGAWLGAALDEVLEVDGFLPHSAYLVVSPWLAVQLSAVAVVALGATWAASARPPEQAGPAPRASSRR